MLSKIESVEELGLLLREADPLYLFKHSTRCPVSAHAFGEFQSFVEAHKVKAVVVDVLNQRDISQAVAAQTGVEHQSPQAMRIEQGEVRWSASHRAITREALEQSL